jgi:hypothetical protein
MLDDNRELIDGFNKEEQKHQRLEQKKLKRRARFPKLSERFHRVFDRLDEATERRRPTDCISKKWIA